MKEAHQFAKMIMSSDMEKVSRATGHAVYNRVDLPSGLVKTYREALSIGLKVAHRRAKAQRQAQVMKVTPKFSGMQKITNFVTKTVADVKNSILTSFLSHQNTREA
jgi:hypothetical protein